MRHIRSHTKDGGVSQTKSLKKGKRKKNSLERTTVRLKIVKLKLEVLFKPKLSSFLKILKSIVIIGVCR